MGKDQEMKTRLLGDLAEICLGKVILKEDILSNGNARVASISNMTEQGLVYDEMEKANMTEEDVTKYAIHKNDILITCRGTKFRAVLVEKLPYMVIASANLMIIRCKKAIDAVVIHLYLQSPMGETEIMKQYKGKNSISIGKKQLQSLEIPELSEESKEKMMQLWKQGRIKYMNTISEADREWHNSVEQVNGFFVGDKQADQQKSVKQSQTIQNKRRQDRLLIELD